MVPVQRGEFKYTLTHVILMFFTELADVTLNHLSWVHTQSQLFPSLGGYANIYNETNAFVLLLDIKTSILIIS